MTGGVVYLLDEDGTAADRLHKDVVGKAATMDDPVLRGLVEEHARETGSPRAAALLASGGTFLRVAPK
jgi:glutamate synthase domain-containing protein 3